MNVYYEKDVRGFLKFYIHFPNLDRVLISYGFAPMNKRIGSLWRRFSSPIFATVKVPDLYSLPSQSFGITKNDMLWWLRSFDYKIFGTNPDIDDIKRIHESLLGKEA